MSASGERTRSLWTASAPVVEQPRLEGIERCDTVVVGAGITGLSVAYELTRAGRNVIVLDRGPVGMGMTARTTAHLAPICDDGLAELIDRRGEDTASLFQASHAAAVDRVEAIINAHDISCNFRRIDGFLFPRLNTSRSEARETIEREYEAARKIGAAVERAKGVALKGFEDAPVLRFPGQGAFHPMKYLNGLIAEIGASNGRLFAHSAVTGFEETESSVRITTDGGATVLAAHAVFATNSPVNAKAALHSKMGPYRTYAVAFTLPRGALPDALYWDMADPYHYMRLNPGPGATDYLIVGGADHKTGEADDGGVRFEALEAWTRALVPDLGREMHRWSGQVLEPFDYCGFIGQDPGSRHFYIATGDSGQGLTHGVIAGMLIKDLIVSGSSPWQEVYDPDRKPKRGVLNYIGENVSSIVGFGEHVTPGEIDNAEALSPGEGGILRDRDEKIAVCRDRDGKLHVRSAACTHMGCTVHWNTTEQCWDCPCHGSHFAPDGAVLTGPAISPLEASDIKSRKSAKAQT
jgi:glycine/D-amino acid oxidase-like deaminating enzyme/nitrite reductase/ring-hydroxylating ferredoxin subunit